MVCGMVDGLATVTVLLQATTSYLCQVPNSKSAAWYVVWWMGLLLRLCYCKRRDPT